MPYLKQQDRDDLDCYLPYPANPGQLNYLLTKVALRYLDLNGVSYQSINDVMGAFASAAQEFYRRVAAPYEDGKIRDNGDVYR